MEKNKELEPLEKKQEPEPLEKKSGARAAKKLATSPALEPEPEPDKNNAALHSYFLFNGTKHAAPPSSKKEF